MRRSRASIGLFIGSVSILLLGCGSSVAEQQAATTGGSGPDASSPEPALLRCPAEPSDVVAAHRDPELVLSANEVSGISAMMYENGTLYLSTRAPPMPGPEDIESWEIRAWSEAQGAFGTTWTFPTEARPTIIAPTPAGIVVTAPSSYSLYEGVVARLKENGELSVLTSLPYSGTLHVDIDYVHPIVVSDGAIYLHLGVPVNGHAGSPARIPLEGGPVEPIDFSTHMFTKLGGELLGLRPRIRNLTCECPDPWAYLELWRFDLASGESSLVADSICLIAQEGDDQQIVPSHTLVPVGMVDDGFVAIDRAWDAAALIHVGLTGDRRLIAALEGDIWGAKLHQDHIYFNSQGKPDEDIAVRRVPVQGGVVEELARFSIASGEQVRLGALGAAHAYLIRTSSEGSSVWRVALLKP